MSKRELRWTYQVGWFLVVIAVALTVPVVALPVFDEQRGVAFWTVIAPLAALGGVIVAYEHYRGGRAAP